uniref:NADH-ubiquinone oxidoreductase chain 3 n=1 Tax=Passalurus ambiguus TaxID=451380 RepID=A0A0P0ISZ2_PASAG|nr:NADH dehydrogenase subunit 3 [Passalurus ambiguus]ALJ93257.1 NADH dehydrogenase subunit 3 [Passalurus ambiguus]
MLVVFFVVLIGLFLVLVLYFGMFLLSVKDCSVFKVFSFESGFKSVGKVQSAFSIHFFVMMLMFVLFDLEVVMLLGLIVFDLVFILVFLVVFFFVSGGFLMEYYFGKLVWIV